MRSGLLKAALCVLLVMSVAVLAAAQNDEPTLLQYKFAPGTTQHTEIVGTGSVPMNIQLGLDAGGQDMSMDIAMDLRLLQTQTCESVSDTGEATMVMKVPSMTVKSSIDVADQKIESLMTWENGQLAMTLNGQAQPLPADATVEQLGKILAGGIKSLVRPDGASRLDAENTKLMQSMTGFSMGLGASATSLMAGFPKQPVKPGDTWTLELKPEEAGGFLAGTGDFKLEGYEDLEGVRCAKITGQARLHSLQPIISPSSAMGQASTINSMEINVEFTNYFDVAKGEMALTKMTLVQNLEMIITMGGQGGAQAMQIPASVQNSQMNMEVRRASATQAPPK
jgi:hypothetical protein